MSDWSRRSVLTTVAALSAGTVASAEVAGVAREDELPNPDLEATPNPDAGWPSHRGGAGHARYVADGPEFEDGTLEAEWSIDHHDEIAVADGTVYATIDDGVVALDAADGALVWENPDVAATAPSVDGERVFLTGTEVVALDRSNGRVRWRTDFGTSEDAAWQTVAYGGVYVVVNEVLYALEPENGSVRWDVASIDEGGDGSGFIAGTAAANGVVYAATERTMLAYDPDTGEEIWRRESDGLVRDSAIQANATAVVSATGSDGDRRRYDAQTGSVLGTRTPESEDEVALGESVAVTLADNAYRGRSLEDDGIEWTLEADDTYGSAAIGGDTVYVAIASDGEEGRRRLLALDSSDGSQRWSVADDEVPIGPIRALTEDAIYVDSDGELIALRGRPVADDDGRDGDDDSDNGDDDESRDRDDSDDGQDDADSGDRDRDDGGSERQPDDSEETNGDSGDDEETDGESGDEGTADENASDGDTAGGDGEGGDSDDGTAIDDNETDGDDDRDDRAEASESDDGADESEDDGSEAESESTDEGGDDGDGIAESDGDDSDDTAEPVSDGDGADADDLEDDAEGMPGFTAGAGIAGGALGLEWLRRRAGADDELEG
ncbi:PQQ-binding-like beta-propeller repeat protein [Natronococcus sp. A-GB1]|uniref:outer membrane protein assembly factor BamB family protein n=1 Tax=Natronococcus sp. A-GB1 TaxID=3037648 RepID=UPI00241DC8AA|nr:PQQ-binding-like beta-propeller repeat protein [Natronococcus sp. A-GB1]MDG5760380.1 PQQ-binding-like beta-propeller repeat protein [Natronococcus sp. A-GB1]